MNSYIGIIVLLIAIYVLFKMIGFSIGTPKERFPYHSKFILTNSEYKFYNSLKPIMDEKRFVICPKVGLKDIIEVNAKEKERQKYFYKISQKHVDFVVCDEKLVPVFAIELDDKSHRNKNVKEKDEFKNKLFKAIDFPLYRVPTNSSYSIEYLEKYIVLEEKVDALIEK